MKETKSADLHVLKQRAVSHMNQKKYSWAMVYYCDILKQLESLIEEIDKADQMEKLIIEIKIPCHKDLSLCYLKQGNYLGCIQQCKHALQTQPKSVQMLFRLGTAYMNTNNLSQAEKYLKQAFILDPNQKQIMKALQRLTHLSNSKWKIDKQQINETKFSMLALIKLFIFWPLFILYWFYRKVIPQKKLKS